MAIGLIDNLILQLGMNFGWTGWTSFLAFGLFIAQTVVLSTVVGLNSRVHWIWWAFFVWSLDLVNLQLLLIDFGTNARVWQGSNSTFSAFVYAFFAAQIGLIVFWAICGSYPRLRIRLPIASVAFMIACHPFWAIGSEISMTRGFRSWLPLLTYFIVASTLTFGVLRYLGFELRLPSLSATGENNQSPQGQFGIKHLLIWTTIVAVLFGLGGVVNWEPLLSSVSKGDFMINSGRTLLVTVILIAVIWAVLGETKLIGARIAVLVAFLLVLSATLYFLDLHSVEEREVSFAIGWVWAGSLSDEQRFEMIKIWTIWTMLNGSFLASLFQVFRAGGFRFMRTVRR